MNRIDQLFKNGAKAFVPYITAGHPTVEDTLKIMKLLVDNGADIIELGMPFSDPTADGPVIQASSQHALDQGFKRNQYFELIRRFREDDQTTPIVAFTYFNPVFNMGVDVYAKTLAEAGGDAMLVVDLPLEEQKELIPALEVNGLHLIQLVAPTTPEDRTRKIVNKAKGFVYQIALKGVTGVRTTLADGAQEAAQKTKEFTQLPVCMGFGVSNGAMAQAVASAADGVIVGSALVKCIADNPTSYEAPLTKLIRDLADASHA